MASSEDDHNFIEYNYMTQRPPLVKPTSRIIYSVVHDNLESLKLLMKAYKHNVFEITDKEGYNIFHISIILQSFTAFDFLLSLDECPLETPSKNGETPLEIALGCFNECSQFYVKEHFAFSLIEKGVAIDKPSQFCCNNSKLHCAIERGFLKVARLLIEKGAYLNHQNNKGQTPLHTAVNKVGCSNEATCMLLYFGADSTIPDFNGTLPFYAAFKNRDISLPTLENLLFCTFDDYSTGCDIPLDDLLGLLRSKSPLLPDGFKYITSFKTDEGGKYPFSFYSMLVELKPDHLKLLIEKFDYILRDLTESSLQGTLIFYICTPTSIENFNLLLQSRFSLDLIQSINQTEIIRSLLPRLKYDHTFLDVISKLIIFMLTYGANIYDDDLENIYQIYGDCEFFRILLHMDILKSDNRQRKPDIMFVLIYDLHADIETFLEDSNKFRLESVKEALNYFAHPKLQKFCRSLPGENQEIIAQINKLPTVPILVELARNEVRKFLIKKYEIENSRQLYTLIKALPISPVHAKIISFETQLYCNNVTIM